MEQQIREDFNPLQMIDDHAAKCNMTTYKLLLTAGMDPSSMHRWRRGSMPNTRTLKKLLSVQPVQPVQPSGNSED